MKQLLTSKLCKCGGSCKKGVFYCFVAYVGLPLEHGMWEWTHTAKFLPLIGLHI